MSEITKKKQSRSGHRAYATKTLSKVKSLMGNTSPGVSVELAQLKLTLTEKIETIKKLDDSIIDLLEKKENVEQEIEAPSEFISEIYGGLAAIDDALKKLDEKKSYVPVEQATETVSHTNSHICTSTRVKLPKLEVRKFSGKIQDWHEFWDSFESAIHKNESLSDVDKFTYLRGLVEQPAKSSIAGFALTAVNYLAAVKVLQRRFGNKTVVQRAYVNELLNVKPVFNANDTVRLRKFFDTVETNFRGLEALGVEKETYSEIVVPTVLNKLPEVVRLTITRDKEHLKWNIKDFVDALQAEVELRECHALTSPAGNNNNDGNNYSRRRREPVTTSTLLARRMDCAYCRGNHKHEDCTRVTGRKERLELLRKFNRCFKCINKGHLARECRARHSCNACGGSHHISICEKGLGENKDDKKGEKERQEKKDEDGDDVHVGNLHVGTKCRVALQTAQGILKGESAKRVRVLFDSGSQKSFVTSKAMKDAKLHVVRREWLEVNTFGGATKDGKVREVVDFKINSVKGSRSIRLEALVVPQICQVRNEHLETVKGEYSHLKDLWLSDVCKSNDLLEIDVLIGADNLWAFQSGRVVKGKDDEPVAVDTCLGWVISGPLKGSSENEPAKVNFVSHGVNDVSDINFNVNKLWDLETLRVKESDDVHEALLDKIKFNGTKYSVKLPWKQGHGHLPTNYSNSLARMKGQIKRLGNEPELLGEYDAFIKDQLESGIIERVSELETKKKVHYLPHQAVIRRDAKTTKLRIVYDASSKEGKRGVSLNDCLHVGPSLTPLLFDILLRFRINPVVLIGDIEKAFLNVEVDREDRDYLRFLWVKDIAGGNLEVEVYRFCRVVFGLNASPFLLNATLRHHTETFLENDPIFVQKMKEGFYVDDLVSGGKHTDDVRDLYEKAKSRMAVGGFKLRKWLTNDTALREHINKQESASDTKQVKRLDDFETYAQSSLGIPRDSSCDKVLGLIWDCEEDLIKFDLLKLVQSLEDKRLTKRNLLSTLAKMFDPLGLVSCVIVLMKILFQQLCVDKVSWDEEIVGKHAKLYLDWIDDLKRVETMTLNRCVYSKLSGEIQSCELHGFGDASEKAYCAVVYFVCRTSTGVHVQLLTAKTRVAPLKALSIPRLELMSALMLAKLVDSVKKALASQVENLETRYWLDSITALYWIQNQGEWKQFVRHRVNQILSLTNKEIGAIARGWKTLQTWEVGEYLCQN